MGRGGEAEAGGGRRRRRLFWDAGAEAGGGQNATASRLPKAVYFLAVFVKKVVPEKNFNRIFFRIRYFRLRIRFETFWNDSEIFFHKYWSKTFIFWPFRQKPVIHEKNFQRTKFSEIFIFRHFRLLLAISSFLGLEMRKNLFHHVP